MSRPLNVLPGKRTRPLRLMIRQPSRPDHADHDHRHARRPPDAQLGPTARPSTASKTSSATFRRRPAASRSFISNTRPRSTCTGTSPTSTRKSWKTRATTHGSPFIFLFDPVPKKDDKAGLPASRNDVSYRSFTIRRATRSLWPTLRQSQLHEIEQLIAEYDRPAPADSVKTRRTAAIKIRYSKATTIATALKDVYRDLLSSRDREFDKGDKRQQSAQQERVTVIEYGQPKSDGSSKRPSPVKIGFEGALSVGVDEVSNMLIVSVQEELFDSVDANGRAARRRSPTEDDCRSPQSGQSRQSQGAAKGTFRSSRQSLAGRQTGKSRSAEAPADQKPKVEAGAKPPGDANAGGNKSN